jgi:protocatechuate 3,4-dioxygenase beta subunit
MSSPHDNQHTRRLLLKSGVALITTACAPVSGLGLLHTEDLDDTGFAGDSSGPGSRDGPPALEDWEDTGVSPPSYCETTVEAGEGPYYLDESPAISDLTDSGESGTVITFTLTVRDAACTLLSGVEVDCWHVQQTSEYDMSGADGNYRCTLRTGMDGTVVIKTIRPIAYATGHVAWIPAHIHFKIRAPGHPELITQLRFVDDPYDDGGVPAEQLLSPTVTSDGSEEASYTFVLPP